MKRLAFLLIIIIATLSIAQSPNKLAQSTNQIESPMPMAAPLFLESDSYSTTAYLVNQLNFGVQADISLYDMNGWLLTTKHIYIQPNSHRALGVKQILSESGLFAEAGSIEVISPQNSSALLGQVSITRSGSAEAYLDEELFMPDDKSSGRLLAVIDSPENSPIVAITNISTQVSQTIHIECVPSIGDAVNKVVTAQPKQTLLVRACSNLSDRVYSPSAIDSQFVLGVDPQNTMTGQRAAGISITTDGPAGELATFGFVEHRDEFGSYFSQMNFTDPKLLNSTSTVFTGVPVGANSLLPKTEYHSQVALTNFSHSTQIVDIYMAMSHDGHEIMKKIASLSAPANASNLIDLPKVASSPIWQNSFIISSTGPSRRHSHKDDVQGQRSPT